MLVLSKSKPYVFKDRATPPKPPVNGQRQGWSQHLLAGGVYASVLTRQTFLYEKQRGALLVKTPSGIKRFEINDTSDIPMLTCHMISPTPTAALQASAAHNIVSTHNKHHRWVSVGFGTLFIVFCGFVVNAFWKGGRHETCNLVHSAFWHQQRT